MLAPSIIATTSKFMMVQWLLFETQFVTVRVRNQYERKQGILEVECQGNGLKAPA